MAVERARTVPLRTAVWMALGSAAFVGAFFAGVLVIDRRRAQSRAVFAP